MIWIIVIIVIAVIVYMIAKGGNSQKGGYPQTSVKQTQNVSSNVAAAYNPELEKVLNEMVDIGVQALTSLDMSESEKRDILDQVTDSLAESTDDLDKYPSQIVERSYQILINDESRFDKETIEVMKKELEQWKQNELSFNTATGYIISHSTALTKPVVKERVFKVKSFETDADKAYKDELVAKFIEANKNLTYAEIEAKIERGKKSNYEEYTLESKMEFRALKILQERIKTKDFRDYFVKKKFIDDKISAAELDRMIGNISFYQSTYKMESIPEDIVSEAKAAVVKKEYEEVRDLLTSKSILQIKNWMEKRELTSLPVKIQEYYQFRIDNEDEEYRLIKETTRLKNNLSQQSKAGNLDKVKEYEPLVAEQEKKLDDFRKSFFKELQN